MPAPHQVPAADILPTAAQVRYRLHVRRQEVAFLTKVLKLLESAESPPAPRLIPFAPDAEPAGVPRG